MYAVVVKRGVGGIGAVGSRVEQADARSRANRTIPGDSDFKDNFLKATRHVRDDS